jgi:hypothetical protein
MTQSLDFAKNKRSLLGEIDRHYARRRSDLALSLASMRDDSTDHFRKRFPQLGQVSDSSLLRMRDWLRGFWSAADSTKRLGWLSSWLEEAWRSRLNPFVVSSMADGTHRVEPHPANLPLILALAASESSLKMGVCENPECPQKYFFKGRKTQRFCDMPACLVFGQKQHRLEWWNSHKRELRDTRKGKSKRRTKQ